MPIRFTRIPLGLLCALLVGCGASDRAELPPKTVGPDTVLALVLDLEHFDAATVEPWLEALDPQGEYLRACDDRWWSLQALEAAGARRMLALVEWDGAVGPSPRLFLHSRSDADPLELLAALWTVLDPGHTWLQGEDLALVPWQTDWWSIDMQGLAQPQAQTNEHGTGLQVLLAQSANAPLRAAFQPPASLAPGRPLGGGAGWMARAFLGSIFESLGPMERASLVLDTRRRSPLLRARVDFGNESAARQFERTVNAPLLDLRQNLPWLVLLAQAPVSATDSAMLEELQATLELATGRLLWQAAGRSSSLVLGPEFFQGVRHLRNLQGQGSGYLAER
ncbi:MAG: hypothetical protein H6829_07230 [Planctomycetes bacterium]|nr:hypothetical protein [Planctomycetota bacterium]MCB9913016.1 hypothetical protein [Planctomycetota bacterium]HPF12676.1 hypothetical protein [Planctomycetota bacterium]